MQWKWPSSPGWTISERAVAIWVPLLLMGTLAKALFAKVSPPEGELLDRKDVPELFAAVDALVKSTGAKSIDRILLVPDFNAFAAEIPRFGAFFPRRYLGLGLPLLMGLTPAQASAVIAHELGDFSARDGRMGNFIYQLRILWGRLLEEADLGVLQRFMRWYAPYFNAYSFVLARDQEYAADRHGAAYTTGARACFAISLSVLLRPWKERRRWTSRRRSQSLRCWCGTSVPQSSWIARHPVC